MVVTTFSWSGSFWSQSISQEHWEFPLGNPYRHGKNMQNRSWSCEAATQSAAPPCAQQSHSSNNHIQFSELLVVTKITRSRVEAAETRFHDRVSGLTLHDSVRSSRPSMLLWFNRWFRRVIRIPPYVLLDEEPLHMLEKGHLLVGLIIYKKAKCP